MYFTRLHILFFLFFLNPCLAMINEKSQFIDADIRDLDIDDLNMCLQKIDKCKKIIFLQGFSLLHLAAMLGATDQACTLIGSKKYDVNDRDNEKGFTPLLVACCEDDAIMAYKLLKCGANPKITNKKGKVPLIKAIQRDNSAMVGILLFYGADVDQKDVINDLTPLHVAISNENSDMVTVLLDYKASPNLSLKHCFTPLMAAAQMEITSKDKETHSLRMITALLDAKADPNIAYLEDQDTALHLAVYNENVSAVYLLLKAGADANALNEKKDTPLHFALRNIQSSYKTEEKDTEYSFKEYRKIAKRNCNIAQLLLLHGAQLSKKQLKDNNIKLNTILIAAINAGACKLVEFALKAGADANYRNVLGDTPLHMIARGISKESQSAVIVALLLEHGADYELLDADQRNALHIFMRNQYMKTHKKNDTVLNVIDTLLESMKTQSNKHNRK